jgi:phosphatidylglycerophosphate synthase
LGTNRSTLIRWGALALGVALFVATLAYIHLDEFTATIARLGTALPLAILFSGLWHLARTIAWVACFPSDRAVGFARLARVRLAAEAFSYLTLRGIAGEPLKVVLLGDRVDPRQATAAVALERIAYLVGTTLIVGVASLGAIIFLPLTHGWFRVFRAFAIAAGVLAVLTAIVVTGRGTYLQSLMRRAGGGDGRVGRFLASVERQMLDLVRDPRRLSVLVACTLAAYVCMALEAWVILRATVAPVSLNGALAIETFSRVASFASAFIPANLGALEASSVAAVAAVGAAGGGAALAVARRIRGLFWAAIGLAIYPRARQGAARAASDEPAHRTERPRGTLLYLPLDRDVTVSPVAGLAGLPIAERVIQAARRAGYRRVLVWLPEADPRLARVLRRLPVEVIDDRGTWQREIAALPDLAVTVIGPGTVVSPSLYESAGRLAVPRGDAVDIPAGDNWPESGVLRMAPSDAGDPRQILDALAERRRRAVPLPDGTTVAHGGAKLALRIVAAGDLAGAEQTIRRSSYKDTDSKIARFNRRMSLPISIALIPTPLTANQLSVMLVALGFYSAWLFSLGHYWTGVLGAFLSLAASVLDGCDGEIARLKYQESALGCWIETVGDYSYYIAIFTGLAVGAARHTGSHAFYWLGAVALAASVVTFALLIFLRSRITAGRPERLHAIGRQRFTAEQSLWSRVIWRISFVATRAAMPYGIMALALLNLLPLVVVLAALGANIYWISLVVKMKDLLSGGEEQSVAA